MQNEKILRLTFIFLIIIAAVSYFAGLPIDVTRDAGKYATISKEVFQNGNFINLTIHGDAYDQKPPMMFWLGALGFAIGGISNFWFKLPMLLLVFAGFYWAFRLGQSLYNTRVGLLTAVILAFSTIYVLYSMDIHADTPLQAFITLALWQLFEFIKTRKNRYWILGFIGIGLAMLSKGPIGAAIPAFAVVGHIILKKDYRFLFDYRWFLGIILAFAVASPALFGLMNQFGWQGIQFFFWENNIGRITGSYVQATNDPLFFVHTLLYVFLPWVLLFFASAFLEFKTLAKNRLQTDEYFTLTGIWIFFLIISVSKNQVPNYVFAIVPLMAVLTAKWIDTSLSNNPNLVRLFIRIQFVITTLLWITVLGIALWLFPYPDWLFWLVLIIAGALSIAILIKSKDKLTRMIAPSLLAFSGLMILLNTHVFPYMFGFQAPPKAARYFTEHAAKNERLYNYYYGQYELFFYSEPQASQIKNENELKEIASHAGSWIFTDDVGITHFEKLKIEPDTIIEYRHLYLNRGGKFINPKTRDQVLKPMFLIKIE